MSDYLEINRALWNDKLEAHLASKMYDMEAFRNGKNSVDEIVLNEIGDVSGKSLLHLQCHFGQDTLSFSRMGARATGLDLSDKCIAKAKELAKELHLDTQFICGNVLDTRKLVHDQFDIVFTSYGTIVWLPDLTQWAKVISQSLVQGGIFYMAEFHPLIQMFDYPKEDITYPYFNSGKFVEESEGTYADTTANLKGTEVFWFHSLGEIFKVLRGQGLELLHFDEHDYSPYDCFGNSVEFSPGKYRFGSFKYPIPHVYSMKWRKN